jgi:hypothetical protein
MTLHTINVAEYIVGNLTFVVGAMHNVETVQIQILAEMEDVHQL